MQDDVSGLRPGEVELTDADEEIWRQVNPAFVHDGRVSSQAFTPTTKDAGELSTNRATKVTPQAAFEYHIQQLELPSAGVYSLTVGEVAEVSLRVVDDSAVQDDEPRPPGHAYVDFKGVSAGKRAKKIGANLREKAEGRGWRYRPDEDQ
ncbi:hypothetical protein [Streptomyces sp. JHA19]|uniref:hypothetical protein n=1 Tax=Streptomyces sp. JHA19 TaxID=1577588 RepID=UPI00131C2319|nr:hypothetical protein [Streptomyces sp. JHA19]